MPVSTSTEDDEKEDAAAAATSHYRKRDIASTTAKGYVPVRFPATLTSCFDFQHFNECHSPQTYGEVTSQSPYGHDTKLRQ